MHIIIVGGGLVGSTLAGKLSVVGSFPKVKGMTTGAQGSVRAPGQVLAKARFKGSVLRGTVVRSGK